MKWAYYTIEVSWPEMHSALNELGRAGWELVSTTPSPFGSDYRCIFKQERPS